MVIMLLFTSVNLHAQIKLECEELLLTEIDLKKSVENTRLDLSPLKKCGLDSLDIEIFSNKVFLASLLIESVYMTNQLPLTFGTILSAALEFKKSKEYIKIREYTIISGELFDKTAHIENWGNDKLKLEKLEIEQKHLEKIHAVILKNSGRTTYREVLFTLYEEQNKIDELKKPNSYADVVTIKGNVNFNEIFIEAKKLEKPLLLYFTGYSCVNCRKMEDNVLIQDPVFKLLENQYYFVSLYVDDKKLLPNTEQFTSSFSGRFIKTVGQKHSNFQMEKFNVNTQPYFAIINNKGDVVATESYSTDQN